MELNESNVAALPAVNGEAGNGKGKAFRITADNAASLGIRGNKSVMRRLDGPPDVRLLRARMAEVERMMRGCTDARLWDMLSRSYERLFKVWQVLAGLPSPGQRRPGPERAKRAATVDPVMPAATEATEESFTDGTEIPPDLAQVPPAQ